MECLVHTYLFLQALLFICCFVCINANVETLHLLLREEG